MNIRLERADDLPAIMRLTYHAFLTLDYPSRRRMDEHWLIHLMQGSPDLIPELCFVAEQDGEIVGHISYSRSEIQQPDGRKIETITFGPLSVLPQRHRTGIGAALVSHSISKARELGYGAVLITGVPDYYPKLGFQRAVTFGLTLEDGSADDSFMAYELIPGYLSNGGTVRFLPPEFKQAEEDDVGFEAFHRQYMAAEFPRQLTLRPLFENDVALVERWLYMPHVAEWYKHPGDWMNELRERHDKFSFITHFIAEYEGMPIGFCQYYDTFFAQEHEVWDDEPDIGENQGEVFSIDYLIGEPKYLKRGFGKEMILQMLEMIQKLGAKAVIVEPEKENTASNRALETSGFVGNGGVYYFNF